MTVRHAALSIGAALVLGLGVYLFVEVRAQPAAPRAASERDRTDDKSDDAPAAGRSDPAATRPATAPGASRSAPTSGHAAPGAGHPETLTPLTPAAPPDPIAAANAAADETLVGPKLDLVMDEANKAYDRGDFDEARTIAGRVVGRYPANVRMLRILVSASCIDGDSATAQLHFGKLPVPDQAQMRIRCARYGVAFADK